MDNQVKERLTGAIILVGVLVLLVPELLTGPKRVPPASEASADEPPLRSYTIELNEDGSRKQGPPAPHVDASESPLPMGANSEMIDDSSGAIAEEAAALEANVAADDEEAGTSPEAEPAVRSSVPVASAPIRAATQPEAAKVAAANEDRAKPVTPKPTPAKAQPKGAGSERSESGSGPVKTASSEARAKPDAAKTPAQDEPAAKPSAPKAAAKEAPKATVAKADAAKGKPAKKGSGWAIQVGSFASRANADRLANELKGKGFSAFVSEGTSGGKKLFRVRVGPEADKAAAQSLAARLRAAGRSGSLVPQS